jgi:sulfite reductase (NADPH) flavoprotein alpha-component
MSRAGLQVGNSPFSQEQVELLNRLLPTLTPEQMNWLDGYMAGVRAAGTAGAPASAQPLGLPVVANDAAPAGTCGCGTGVCGLPVGAATAVLPAAQAADLPEVTVLFGSQTGNAERLAKQLTQRLRDRSFAVNISCMSEYKPTNLKKAKCVFVVVSTHGNGEPPDKAKTLHEFVLGKRAPKLEGVPFSVLALGDITYERFCQTGKDFDRRLEELGGQRLFDRTDCDVDYEESAAAWMDGVLGALEGRLGGASGPSSGAGLGSGLSLPVLGGGVAAVLTASERTLSAPAYSAAAAVATAPSYTRNRPYYAEVLENLDLNGRGSDKETRYLKLAIEGSGLTFEPGDSLGICPQNHPDLVDELIREMRWNADEPVPVGKEERPLREALAGHYEITVLTRPLLEQAADFSHDGLPNLVRSPAEQLRAYIEGRDLLDLVRDYSLTGAPAREFVGRLRKLPGRLYSISSSQRANPDEVDVTIAAVRYQAHQRDRFGTCSIHCAERVAVGDRVPIYVHSNPNFRLPSDPDAPIIMIGAGTGVAPFRAFVEDREETGAQGKSWLFFGDRRFRTDFLYQTEWQRWIKQGVLTRMDVAFSRDTGRKVYVQHRMMEQSREFFSWLEEGAYVYVCGSEEKLAPDVHATLTGIVEREGGLRRDEAEAYVADLQREGRYQRDVY